MILGPKRLLELVKKKKLVEGLADRELLNPEGAGFDLRLGEIYKISGTAFLGETERKTPTVNFKPRTTTFRSGLFLRTGNVAPGYKGPATCGLKNEGKVKVTIELG